MRSILALLVLSPALFAGGDVSVEDHVAALMRSGAGGRRTAAKGLRAQYPDSAIAIPLLVDALRDSDKGVREEVALTLGSFGRKGLASMLKFLASPTDPSRKLISRLGKTYIPMGGSLMSSDLHGPLGYHNYPAVRRAAAALTILCGPMPADQRDRTLDVLQGSLSDPAPTVREMAATSLALIGWYLSYGDRAGTKVTNPILRLMESDDPVVVHLGACLVGLVCPESLEFRVPMDDAGVSSAMKDWALFEVEGYALGHGDAGPSWHKETIQVLQALEASRPAVHPKKQGRRDSELRKLLDGLRRAGKNYVQGPGDMDTVPGPELAVLVAPALKRFLGKERAWSRIDVAVTLIDITDDYRSEIARELAACLTDEHEATFVRMLALPPLARLGKRARPAVPAIAQVLRWKEPVPPDRYWNLAHASANLGSAWWAERRAKRAAAVMLAGFKSEKDVEKLLRELKNHPDWRLRYRAANALRR